MIFPGDILAVTPEFMHWMGDEALFMSNAKFGDEYKVLRINRRGAHIAHFSGAMEFVDVPLRIVLEMRDLRLEIVSYTRLN